jgi:hypothetical protein
MARRQIRRVNSDSPIHTLLFRTIPSGISLCGETPAGLRSLFAILGSLLLEIVIQH